MTDLIGVNQVFSQIALKKLAYFGGSTLGNDIYYMKEFLDLMINIIGEDKLIHLLMSDSSNNKSVNNRLGNQWNESKGIKNRLKKFDKIVDKTKRAYDCLNSIDIKKKDTKDYKYYIKNAESISMIKPDMNSLLVFIIDNCSIQKMTIKDEDFKRIYNKGYKSFGDFDKRRVGDKPVNKE